MQIENHKEEVPFAHYEQLFRETDPERIARRLPETRWDGEHFYLQLMHKTYVVSHKEATVCGEAEENPLPMTTRTFLLRYLLESREVPSGGRWKTFREMPWGEMYMKPYSGRVLSRAAFTFGTQLDAFRAACKKMGATPVNHGNAGYEFRFIGNYKMQILVWEGDEEFPPNAQILYSDNFAEGFTAEDRVVAADILIAAIKENM